MAYNETEEEKKNWTIMVYLAGDNNLTEEMVFALTSMFSEGSPSEDTRVVALYDSIGALVAFDIPVKAKSSELTPVKPEHVEVAHLRAGKPGFVEVRAVKADKDEHVGVDEVREDFLEKRDEFLDLRRFQGAVSEVEESLGNLD